jgi:ubiquinone/menaquinone biosynthesis C-methylase UbiE
MSKKWDQIYGRQDRYGLTPCSFAVTAAAQLIPASQKRVLDLGGGEGRDSVYFAKRGFETFCLDFSDKAISSCIKKAVNAGVTVHPVRHDIMQPLPFKDSYFDAVFAHLSLQYFDDETTTQTFKEIRRVLKTGGLLFIKVKATDDPLYGLGQKMENDVFRFGHIRHFFSRQYLLSKACGFKTLSIKHTCEHSKYDVRGVSKQSSFWEYIGKKNKETNKMNNITIEPSKNERSINFATAKGGMHFEV